MRWRFTGDNRSYGTWHAETELALVVWGQIRLGQVLERASSIQRVSIVHSADSAMIPLLLSLFPHSSYFARFLTHFEQLMNI